MGFKLYKKSAVEKHRLARKILFDLGLALFQIMSKHVFITKLSIVVPKRDGIVGKQKVSQEAVTCGPHGRLRC